MADTTQTVKIDIVADASKFREELKKSASATNSFNKDLKTVKNVGIKDDKNLQRLAKDFKKFNKGAAEESLKYEKKLVKEMKTKQKLLRQMHSEKKTETAQFKDEAAQLLKTSKLYAKMRRDRVQASGLTMKEKAQNKIGESGSWGGVAGGVGKGALLIAGAAIGAITQRINAAADAAAEYRMSGAAISHIPGASFASMEGARARGVGMGFKASETMQQAGMIAGQTGNYQDVTSAQKLSRVTGMDFGATAGFMGGQARGGITGPSANKQQEKIIATGVFQGLDKGRLPELFQATQSLLETASGRTSRDVDAGGIGSALQYLSAGGQSGLKGARGASVLAQMDAGVRSPGGGEAGQAMIMRGYGFGMPGQNVDYYSAKKRQQQGFIGGDGKANVQNIRDQIKNALFHSNGDVSEASMIMGNTLGMDYQPAEDLIRNEMKNSGKSNSSVQAEMDKILEQTKGVDEKLLDVVSGELLKQTQREANLQDRLVTQGLPILEDMQNLQNTANKIMDDMWPLAVKSLSVIASGVENIWGFLSNTQDKQDGYDPDAKQRRLRDEIATDERLKASGALDPFIAEMNGSSRLAEIEALKDENKRTEYRDYGFLDPNKNRHVDKSLEEDRIRVKSQMIEGKMEALGLGGQSASQIDDRERSVAITALAAAKASKDTLMVDVLTKLLQAIDKFKTGENAKVPPGRSGDISIWGVPGGKGP